MTARRRGPAWPVAVVALVALAAGGVAVVGAADAPVVAVDDATATAGGTDRVAVTLSAAPDGVAGYRVRVGVADTGVAVVTDVEAPDAAGEAFVVESVAADGSAATVERVDVSEAVEPGATGIRLASVTVEGVAAGRTALSVTVERFDDDAGAAMRPATDDGTARIGSAADADGDGGAGSGGGDGAGSGGPTATGTPTPRTATPATGAPPAAGGTDATPAAGGDPAGGTGVSTAGETTPGTATAAAGATEFAVTSTRFPGFGPVALLAALAVFAAGVARSRRR